MSKLNVGVGEEFPLGDVPKQSGEQHNCRQHWRHNRHRHGMRAAGALIVLPVAAASVTAAIMYPLVTLGLIGGLGVAAAAHRRSRWRAYREAYRDAMRARAERKPHSTPPAPPQESA
ncbi:MAG: hypothetical protein K8S25_18115 [Alphaproteobacteria bacterium]|nr:hypothetical protein [Alphaproteobacteria bacterium]